MRAFGSMNGVRLLANQLSNKRKRSKTDSDENNETADNLAKTDLEQGEPEFKDTARAKPDIDNMTQVLERVGPLLRTEYAKERDAGDLADRFGTSQHFYYPKKYPDFSRRFVLQYPYKEIIKKTTEPDVTAEALLDEMAKDANPYIIKAGDMKLMPVKASPEIVLKVAMASALREASQPDTPRDVEKDILRTGDYWNSFWKEDVNPKQALRSHRQRGVLRTNMESDSLPKLSSVKTRILPGSQLYRLVSTLKEYSPRLLYVINNKD